MAGATGDLEVGGGQRYRLSIGLGARPIMGFGPSNPSGAAVGPTVIKSEVDPIGLYRQPWLSLKCRI